MLTGFVVGDPELMQSVWTSMGADSVCVTPTPPCPELWQLEEAKQNCIAGRAGTALGACGTGSLGV